MTVQEGSLTPESESVVPASRARLILSVYLDFVVFSVVWAFLDYFVVRPSPDWQRLSTPGKFVTFAILELLLHRVIRWSPGQWLLSIRLLEYRDLSLPIESSARRDVPFVSTHIKDSENWFTILTAALVLLEGTKGLVRWTMWTPPTPMFGAFVDAGAWPFVAMTGGAIECLIAYLLFRTRPVALVPAILYFITMLVSIVMSWNLWDTWVAESVRRRRAYQGIPLREREIEQAQALTPEIVVLGVAFYLVIVVAAGLVLIYRRGRESHQPAAAVR